MNATIYHNARCSKSRATLTLLEQHGVPTTIICYLDCPPNESELADILRKLGTSPVDVIRFGESVALELGIRPDGDLTDSEWIELMVANPILIERPIVVVGDRAAIGRPPENVLGLLS